MKTLEKTQRDTFDAEELCEMATVHYQSVIENSVIENSVIEKPAKDIWDKLGAVAPIVSGMLIFVMGGWFTYTFNQQQLRLQEIQTIEKFIPHLMGNDQSKRAAILAISSLTNAEMATKFAQIFSSPGTVSALQSLAENGTEKDKSIATDALARALENLAARESRLNDIEVAFNKTATERVSSNSKNDGPADQIDEAQKLEHLAVVCRERGHLTAAEALLKQAVNVRLKATGDSKDAVNTLRKLAEVQQAQGNSAEAEETSKKVATLENKLNPSVKEPSAPSPPAPPAVKAVEEKQEARPAPQPTEASEKAGSEPKPEAENN